jgi:hypothetical protein
MTQAATFPHSLGRHLAHGLSGVEGRQLGTAADAPELIKICRDPANDIECAHVLGLHVEDKTVCLWNFVGAVWLRHGEFVLSQPKPFLTGRRIDYISMWLSCLEDPVVADQMDDCFYCWPDEDPIPIDDQRNEFSLLIVLTFLRSLYVLCTRHIRRNFVHVSEDLVGKVKGRILLERHLRDNVARGRSDRTWCSYEIISNNCKENQILRAALERCAKFLSRPGFAANLDIAHTWIHACRASLAQVEVKRVTEQWFRGIWYGGSFLHYRHSHLYAKMLLGMVGLDPDSDIPGGQDLRIPPFALCTSELFERFCETRLRQHPKIAQIRPGYGRRSGTNLGGSLALRPDFLLVFNGEAWIADAKYKPGWSGREIENGGFPANRDDLKSDVFQVIAYSRHLGVRKFPDRSSAKEALERSLPCESALILFPSPQESLDWQDETWLSPQPVLERDFENPRLFRSAVPCPGATP